MSITKYPGSKPENAVQDSEPPSPILTTEQCFFATDRAADKEMAFSDADDKFDILKPLPQFLGQDNKQALELNGNRFTFVSPSAITEKTMVKEPEQLESFVSIAEEHESAVRQDFPFQETKRKASCCSLFTFWYANTLVDSIELNNGKMDQLFIENMNADPKRDEKLLANFQNRLKANHQSWKNNNPNSTANDQQWYGFTKKAIRSIVGCHFIQVAILTFLAEVSTLLSIFMIKFLAEYLIKEEGDL